MRRGAVVERLSTADLRAGRVAQPYTRQLLASYAGQGAMPDRSEPAIRPGPME